MTGAREATAERHLASQRSCAPKGHDGAACIWPCGLMHYDAGATSAYRRIAAHTPPARILKGKKTTDLVVKRRKKFPVELNLKTAKSLGRTMRCTSQRVRRCRSPLVILINFNDPMNYSLSISPIARIKSQRKSSAAFPPGSSTRW